MTKKYIGDSDVISSLLSMPDVLAAMMWGKEMQTPSRVSLT